MHPDSNQTGGFLGKVMHLMRGKSLVDIAEGADGLGAEEDSSEQRARRRRNEAIRRQEFAHLRQLRLQGDVAAGQNAAQPARDESLLSVLGQETRSEETLQKIDAIEAQMSDQWWRQRPAAAARAADTSSEAVAAGAAAQAARSVSEPSSSLHASPSVPSHALGGVGETAAAQSSDERGLGYTQPTSASSVAPVGAVPPPPSSLHWKPHPEVGEAAILFAHGDLDGARARLLELLLQTLGVEPVDNSKLAMLWHAALELCRMTGDEAAFEPLAIDYAEHFGRSAPLWMSVPQRLGLPALLSEPTSQSSPQRALQWSAPAVLTVSSVAALRASLEGALQPYELSWRRLATIEEDALQSLTELVQAWADSDDRFACSDVGALLRLLEQHTEVSVRTHPDWWSLRMAVLRWLGQMDAYEQVALDYCMTYEVSPPSWEPACCQCLAQEEGQADASQLPGPSTATEGSQASPTSMSWERSLGLAGVMEGDVQEWLDVLAQQAQSGQVLEVSCEYLIRMDFVAASGVLNWAAQLQEQGVSLRFTRLHHLMASFFHVMGIHEHAAVQATPV